MEQNHLRIVPPMGKKLKKAGEAVEHIKDGMILMVGGFVSRGMPLALIDALVTMGTSNLTVVTNDPGRPDVGVGRLVRNRQVKKLYASHVGMNPEVGIQVQEGFLELHLIPQGTLAEKIRCGGFGLGGVLTPVGLGTLAEEGKELVSVNGRDYLLELPLKADVAIIKAHTGDYAGNLIYRGTSQNFNPVMAYAADLVIAEVDNMAGIGQLDPNRIMTPGILVDILVVKE